MTSCQSTYAIRQNLNLVPTVAPYFYMEMTDTVGQEIKNRQQDQVWKNGLTRQGRYI